MESDLHRLIAPYQQAVAGAFPNVEQHLKKYIAMPIDYQIVARKLLTARTLQSLDLNEVSRQTGIPNDRIGQIESGQFKPSGDEVLILSNFYRHDFRDFLDDTRPALFEQTEILYRRHGDAFRPEDRRAVREFLYLCEIESFLETELNVQKQRFFFKPTGRHYKTHGEQAAQKLRDFLGYASNAIPRDVFEDFRQLGCHVFRRRLVNSNISGLYIEHPVTGHCILVNYDEDIYRQRFSVSHEAAHAIFDSSESVVVTFRESTGRHTEDRLKEIRANRFASCYLLPPNLLPRVPQWTTEKALEWAQKLRVSTTALSISLREAKFIDDNTAATIRSVKVPSVDKLDPEAPTNLTEMQRTRRLELLKRGLSNYYVGLCFDAYQNGIVSAGYLGEALLADHIETRDISVLFGRSINHGS